MGLLRALKEETRTPDPPSNELTGNHGTVLYAELYKPDKLEQQSISSIKGVAKDDKGNIYKIAF